MHIYWMTLALIILLKLLICLFILVFTTDMVYSFGHSILHYYSDINYAYEKVHEAYMANIGVFAQFKYDRIIYTKLYTRFYNFFGTNSRVSTHINIIIRDVYIQFFFHFHYLLMYVYILLILRSYQN